MRKFIFQIIRKNHKQLLIIFFLAVSFLPSVWSLFHPGFFLADDAEWMLVRLTDFHRSVASGQIPVRWLARINFEYGYPVANFLYPGFLYIGEIIHLLGFGFGDSIKIILGLSLVSSGIFSYLWLSKIFNRFSAIIGAIFYVYAPYHLYDVYRRGSVGEVLAMAFVPLCLWFAEKKKPVFVGLIYGLIIISHNTIAFLFTPILVLYLFTVYKTLPKGIRYSLYSLLYGLGVSAFFWIPAVFDLHYTVFQNTLVINWQSAFFSAKHVRLIDPATVIIFLLSIFFIKRIGEKIVLFWVVFPLSFFLTLPQSGFFWQILPLYQVVQFSFRFLFWTVLSGSFLVAFVLSEFPVRIRIVSGVVLAGLLFMFSLPFLTPQTFFDKGETFYTTNEDTTTVKGEYMPRWVKKIPTERPQRKIELVSGKGKIEDQLFNSRKGIFTFKAQEDSITQINVIYFPGWRARIDGKEVSINYGNERGLIQILIPRGEHKVSVEFSETPLRLFSDIISLLSLLFISFFILKRLLENAKRP